MAYPAASGVPNYSGVLIPEVWSGKLIMKLYESCVLASISNTIYEGEIKNQGDTVHIRTTPNLTIRDHVRGQKLVYEQLEPSNVELLIDKGKTWGFVSDDVTKKQADYAYLEDWTKAAAMDLKIAVEKPILQTVYADAHVKNQGIVAGVASGSVNLGATGAPLALTKANIVDFIIQAGQVLSEQNVPPEDCFIVLPPWAFTRIKLSDLKDASLSGDATSLLRRRDGRVGTIGRFEVYESNLLSTVTDGPNQATHMIFGHKYGLTFASQLLLNEGPMRSTDYFGDLYRGLQVYGFRIIKPECFGHLYGYPA